jgi:predicted site-specific integrase-resolvase
MTTVTEWDDSERMLRVDEACEFFGVKRATLNRWTKAGLPVHHLNGTRTVYLLSELQAFVKAS